MDNNNNNAQNEIDNLIFNMAAENYFYKKKLTLCLAFENSLSKSLSTLPQFLVKSNLTFSKKIELKLYLP